MKTYHASNLEQIAVMFEDNAKKAEEAANRAINKKQSAIQKSISSTWSAAAFILRDTELHS